MSRWKYSIQLAFLILFPFNITSNIILVSYNKLKKLITKVEPENHKITFSKYVLQNHETAEACYHVIKKMCITTTVMRVKKR